jgi:uncharacterized protein GlcG (DUF336 family)
MTLTVQANTLINAAFAKRHELGLKPPVITVHDADGHTIACPRQDGGLLALGEARHVKACSALALGGSSRTSGEMALDRPHFIASVERRGRGWSPPSG